MANNDKQKKHEMSVSIEDQRYRVLVALSVIRGMSEAELLDSFVDEALVKAEEGLRALHGRPPLPPRNLDIEALQYLSEIHGEKSVREAISQSLMPAKLEKLLKRAANSQNYERQKARMEKMASTEGPASGTTQSDSRAPVEETKVAQDLTALWDALPADADFYAGIGGIDPDDPTRNLPETLDSDPSEKKDEEQRRAEILEKKARLEQRKRDAIEDLPANALSLLWQGDPCYEDMRLLDWMSKVDPMTRWGKFMENMDRKRKLEAAFAAFSGKDPCDTQGYVSSLRRVKEEGEEALKQTQDLFKTLADREEAEVKAKAERLKRENERAKREIRFKKARAEEHRKRQEERRKEVEENLDKPLLRAIRSDDGGWAYETTTMESPRPLPPAMVWKTKVGGTGSFGGLGEVVGSVHDSQTPKKAVEKSSGSEETGQGKKDGVVGKVKEILSTHQGPSNQATPSKSSLQVEEVAFKDVIESMMFLQRAKSLRPELLCEFLFREADFLAGVSRNSAVRDTMRQLDRIYRTLGQEGFRHWAVNTWGPGAVQDINIRYPEFDGLNGHLKPAEAVRLSMDPDEWIEHFYDQSARAQEFITTLDRLAREFEDFRRVRGDGMAPTAIEKTMDRLLKLHVDRVARYEGSDTLDLYREEDLVKFAKVCLDGLFWNARSILEQVAAGTFNESLALTLMTYSPSTDRALALSAVREACTEKGIIALWKIWSDIVVKEGKPTFERPFFLKNVLADTSAVSPMDLNDLCYICERPDSGS